MQKILNLLNSSGIVYGYEVLDFKQGDCFSYLKLRAELINSTYLYVRIYISRVDYIYSFHWQDKNNNLIIRWDNAPHHNNVSTFPHHKHIGEQVTESYEVTVEEVLSYIGKETKWF